MKRPSNRPIDVDTAVYYIRQCLKQNPSEKEALTAAINDMPELHEEEEPEE
jgi:hypothetical protein